jgi:hypothetical protein
MQIELSNEIEKKLRTMHKEMGVELRELVEKAIVSFYLNEIALKEELNLWEKSSDEDFANFEKSL